MWVEKIISKDPASRGGASWRRITFCATGLTGRDGQNPALVSKNEASGT